MTPLIRRDRALEPASWEEALEHAVERLSGLRRAGEVLGVLGSPRATNEENFLGARLARAVLQTDNVDFCTRSAYQPSLSGIEEVPGGVPPSVTFKDVEQSDVVVLLEGNLARTHPRIAFSVMRAVRRGARLVTVGCAATQMSRLAALHLPVVPGLERLTIERVLQALPESSRLAAASNPIDGQARQVAAWLVEAKAAVFLLGLTGAPAGPARGHAAALAEVAARAGFLGVPGSGLMVLPARGNFRGAREMGAVPNLLPGCRPLDDGEALQRLREIWGDGIAARSGLDAQALVGSARGLVVVADDPPAGLPDSPEALRALQQLDFLLVLDAFETPTSRAAEVVMPIAAHPENEGTWTNAEGRVQRVRTATRSPGEARPGWAVLAELARRLGARASYRSPSDVFVEIAVAASSYAELTYPGLQARGGWTAAAALPAKPRRVPLGATATSVSDRFPCVLVREGAFDWGADPLVRFSPTLCRDHVSRRKLHPGGVVEISTRQADELGIRQGRLLTLTSAHGSATLPADLREDLMSGVLRVPFAFYEHAAEAFRGEETVAVRVEGA